MTQCIAGFAAFAGRFDVYYGFPSDRGLEIDYVNPSYSSRTTGFFAFHGMAVMYIISRVILGVQYLLVYLYAIRRSYPARRQFLVQVGGVLISAGLWIGSFFCESKNAGPTMQIAKFVLWYSGILVELVLNVVVSLCCQVTGFRRSHLGERFATLTLLILGEGVIGYAIALQRSKNYPSLA